MSDLKQIEKTVQIAFPDARFVVIFGSQVSGSVRPDSDLDVAIYFGKIVSPQKKADLLVTTEPLFDIPLNLVFLDDADPIIRMQVIKKGRLVPGSNLRAFHLFQMKTLSEYNDYKIQRKLVEHAMIKDTML